MDLDALILALLGVGALVELGVGLGHVVVEGRLELGVGLAADAGAAAADRRGAGARRTPFRGLPVAAPVSAHYLLPSTEVAALSDAAPLPGGPARAASLDDRYLLTRGRVYLTGVQALVRPWAPLRIFARLSWSHASAIAITPATISIIISPIAAALASLVSTITGISGK